MPQPLKSFMLSLSITLVFALTLSVFSTALNDPNSPLIISTTTGMVNGTFTDTHRAWMGIPFGENTGGVNRFQNPIPKKKWSGVLKTQSFGPGCLQSCELPPHTCPIKQSEDCLSLNIFVPKSIPSGKKLPVLFFIPGGRFEQGAGGTNLYYGSTFANHTNTVVVTINYRLGVFAALTTDSGLPGNLATKDQILALTWIRDNIGNFGGDVDQITISGQSAGGTSVGIFLTAPELYGMYNQAIMESNPSALMLKDSTEAKKMGKLFTDAVNCKDSSNQISCLQNTSVSTLLAAQKTVGNHIFLLHPLQLFYCWTPHIDGRLIIGEPWSQFAKGEFNKNAKLLLGDVESEAILFIYQAAHKPVDHVDYDAALALCFHDHAFEIGKQYPMPSNETSDTRTHLAKVGTDYIFVCPNRNIANSVAKFSHNVPYFYIFDHAIDASKAAWGPNYEICWNIENVCHGSELVFWFQPPVFDSWGQGELELSWSIMDYWGNFVKSGNPNGPGLTQWDEWNPSTQPALRFHTGGNSIEYKFHSQHCDFWDTIGYSQP